MSAETSRLRLGMLGVVALSLLCSLFVRLWYLQVLEAPAFEQAAAIVQLRTISEEAPRGRILDAKGRVIVGNRISVNLVLDPSAFETTTQRRAVLIRVAQELTARGVRTKVRHLEELADDARYNEVEPRPIATDVGDELAVLIGERGDEFRGIRVDRRAVRRYPFGRLAAHVVGYVGRIGPDELDAATGNPALDDKPYDPQDTIGKTGVEKIFETDLRGVPGRRTVEVAADERVLRTVDYVPPVPGHDIQLALDIDVQALAESSLAQQIGRTGSPAGSIVILDPTSGSVQAMASYPTYDPNEFTNGISEARYQTLLHERGANPFLNRAVQSAYAPGSTFKLVTAFAALDDGMITGATGYQDNGAYRLQGCDGDKCVFTNAENIAHGWVPLPKAITVSSDVYFYWLGEKYWLERERYGDGIQDAARQFGMGTATGIALPSEASGLVPDPETKKRRHEENPEAFPFGDWFTGDNVNLAIGQGDLLVTPLQLANAYATFANGGSRLAPNVAWRVIDTSGDGPAELVREFLPRVADEISFRPEVTDPIRSGLEGVPHSELGGTAGFAFDGFDLSAYPIAAKTGTAQVLNKEDTSLFAAYGPAADPAHVVVIVIEEGGFGSEAAAPIARELFDRFSRQARLEPAPTDDPIVVLRVPTTPPEGRG